MERLGELDAGVVEGDVETSLRRGDPVDKGLHLRRYPDVGLDVHGLATGLADFLLDLPPLGAIGRQPIDPKEASTTAEADSRAG